MSLSEGFSGFIQGFRPAPDQGRTLEQALQRTGRQSWYDAEPEPVDPDDRISALLARGYSPGLTGRLSQRLGDTLAELEAEQEKLAVSARRQDHVRRMHEAGRIDAWQMMEQLHGDDEGDEGQVRLLEHQAADLRAQLADAAERVAPAPQRDLDPVEAAVSRASSAGHEAFREATRAAMAAAGQRPAGTRAPRPFVSGEGEAGEVSAEGPEITRSAGSCCGYCTEYGVSAAESVRLHASMMASQQ